MVYAGEGRFDEAIDVLDEGPLPVGASRVRVTEGKRLTVAVGGESGESGRHQFHEYSR